MFSLKLLPLKKALRPLFGDWVQLLFFNTRSLGLPGAYLVDLRKKNGLIDFGATQLFSTQDVWIGNPAPETLGHCSFRLTHVVFIYEQTLFNFSNVLLKYNLLHNPFFIHVVLFNSYLNVWPFIFVVMLFMESH